jgi:hypothetical protein
MKEGESSSCFRAEAAPWKATEHAGQRMAQRNLSFDDVHFVLRHGQKLHRAGVIIYFLRGRDIPAVEWRRMSRLEGTVVVVSRDGAAIVTVYRNRRRGLPHIKQKPRYGRVY